MRTLIGLYLLALSACNLDPIVLRQTLVADAGVRLDADVAMDASELPDAGEASDVGFLPDAGTLLSAVSRKDCDIPIHLSPSSTASITTEPRVGRISRIVFQYGPNPPAHNRLTIEEDATCPGPPVYAPYTGTATAICSIAGLTLDCIFSVSLENARTYRFTVPQGGTGTTSVELRGLIADANGDGQTNSLDRSRIVQIFTGPPPMWTCETDLDGSGVTDDTDREIVEGFWVGGPNCAP